MSEREELDGMAAYLHAIQNPSRDDPTWPLPSFDARDWAEAFCKQYPDCDNGAMVAWFANALMRGYDEASIRAAADFRELRAQLAAARDAALEEAAAICDKAPHIHMDRWTAQTYGDAAARIRALKGPRT